MRPKRKAYVALTIRISQDIYDQIEKISDTNGLYKTQNISRMIELGIRVEEHILNYLDTAFKRAAEDVLSDNLPTTLSGIDLGDK